VFCSLYTLQSTREPLSVLHNKISSTSQLMQKETRDCLAQNRHDASAFFGRFSADGNSAVNTANGAGLGLSCGIEYRRCMFIGVERGGAGDADARHRT